MIESFKKKAILQGLALGNTVMMIHTITSSSLIYSLLEYHEQSYD